MSEPLQLFANLGAEEGAPASRSSSPHRSRARDAWRLLFARDSEWSDGDAAAPWPAELLDGSEHAAFPWLPTGSEGAGLVPWLSTADAEAAARARGHTLLAAAPGVVATVHDKAFCARACTSEGLDARPLRGLRRVLEPEDLRAPGALAERVRECLREWPAWARASFTVKPRFGTSGRGRIAGANGDLVLGEDANGAAARLAARGGAIVEPWLRRRADLSAQLWIPRPALPEASLAKTSTPSAAIPEAQRLDPRTPDANAARSADNATQPSAAGSAGRPGAHVAGAVGEQTDSPIVFAASLVALCSASGVPLAHRGEIDSRGRVFSGNEFEEGLRELAAALAGAARAAGYWGPCGVDAAVFEHEGRRWLQPLEVNARYTLGLAAAGIARRALPRFRAALGLRPGERNAFAVQLAPARPRRDADDASSASTVLEAHAVASPAVSTSLAAAADDSARRFRIALGSDPPGHGEHAPQLLAARDPEELGAAFDAQAGAAHYLEK